MSDLVCIETFPSKVEAEISKDVLEANGIQAMVDSDDAGGMMNQFELVIGVKLLVNEADSAAARAVLEASEQSPLTEDMDVGPPVDESQEPEE